MDPLLLTTFLEVVAWIMIMGFWVLVIWMFIFIFMDILKRRDLSGLGKAGWMFLIFILPVIGVLIYLVTRPRDATHSDDIGVLVSQMSDPTQGVPRGS